MWILGLPGWHPWSANGETVRRVLLAVLSLLFLAGCSTSNAAPDEPKVGPLGTREPVGEYCLPLWGNGRITMGWEVLENKGDVPVTINSVSLTDPHNLVIDQVRLQYLDEEPGMLVGVRRDWKKMDKSMPGIGATIEPIKKDDRGVGLVLLMSTPDDTSKAWSGPARVTYTADGETYTWVGGSSMTFPPGRQECFKDDPLGD